MIDAMSNCNCHARGAAHMLFPASFFTPLSSRYGSHCKMACALVDVGVGVGGWGVSVCERMQMLRKSAARTLGAVAERLAQPV